MQTTIDFNKTLIRCSAIGMIMTEPRGCITEKQLEKLSEFEKKGRLTDKQREEYLILVAKKAESGENPLSDTCKNYLREVYLFQRYGRKIKCLDEIKQIVKGRMVEEEAITLVCRLDKKFYEKNEERIENEFLSGIPDLYEGESIYKADFIDEIKSSWDLDTFSQNVDDGLDTANWWQMQGYFALTSAKNGAVNKCLVNTPEKLIMDEIKKLFYSMDVATEQNPEFLAAAEEIRKNMIFDDIPIQERRIKFEVERDDAAIAKVYERVKGCRKWLVTYDQMYRDATIGKILESQVL